MTRDIHIIPVLNGYLCKVGCQSVVFQDRTQMVTEIDRYYGDPEAVEKEYVAKAVNKMRDELVPCCEPTTLSQLNQAQNPRR